MKKIRQKPITGLEKIAIRSTNWIGSTQSLVFHTIVFIAAFLLYFLSVNIETILLVLTTVVSLEAIYLAIFIQMSVNRQAEKLEDVSEDIEEIQEDMEEIEKDIDEIQEDVEGIEKDIDEIQEDVEEIHNEELSNLIEKAKKKQKSGNPEDKPSAKESDILNMLQNLDKKLVELQDKIKESKPESKPKVKSLKQKVNALLNK